MTLTRVLALLLVLLTLALSACGGGRSSSAEDLAAEFADAYGSLPAGKLYLSEAEEWEEGYISDELCAALFGEEQLLLNEGDGLKFCIWLGESRETAAEFAIFVCGSRSEAERISELCLLRIGRLGSPTYGTADNSAADSAFVTVSGKAVVYAAMPDRASAERAVKRVIG